MKFTYSICTVLILCLTETFCRNVLATSYSTFQSAVEEKNVDLHLRLQRLTTRIFDYQPKNGQKRKRVSKYKNSVKRATVNYFSIVFLEFVILNGCL